MKLNALERLTRIYLGNIYCGFPSPSQDYMDKSLDFKKEIIPHPAATFYGTAVGDSMIEAGIEEGDILVVDKSLDACDGDIVVFWLNGHFSAKYLDLSKKDRGIVKLVSANPRYKDIIIHKDEEFNLLGVVRNIIKRLK